jgi:GNAT superfamily N-acetyltransferase
MKLMFQYREIKFGTAEYDETVELRMEVLRRPLGISFEPEVLAAEYSDHHLCAFDENNRIVGCLVMTPLENNEIQMRQFAVHFDYQRKGVGTELVKFAEEWSAERGFKKIILHARATAVPFYLKSNYLVTGEEFIEVSIPHRLMYKMLE